MGMFGMLGARARRGVVYYPYWILYSLCGLGTSADAAFFGGAGKAGNGMERERVEPICIPEIFNDSVHKTTW